MRTGTPCLRMAASYAAGPGETGGFVAPTGLPLRPGAAERAVGGGEATPFPRHPSAEGGGEPGAPGQAGAPSSAPGQGQG